MKNESWKFQKSNIYRYIKLWYWDDWIILYNAENNIPEPVRIKDELLLVYWPESTPQHGAAYMYDVLVNKLSASYLSCHIGLIQCRSQFGIHFRYEKKMFSLEISEREYVIISLQNRKDTLLKLEVYLFLFFLN